MRTPMPLVISTVLMASTAVPCRGQTRVATLDDLRRVLAAGDSIVVVQAGGQPVAGRLTRLGTVDVDVRPKGRDAREHGRSITIQLDRIQSLERPRDSARNGAVLGAAIGGGFAAVMTGYALAVDRNEIDEWAGTYAAAGAACTGIGTLVGWALDAARSKPHVRFDAPAPGRTTISVLPVRPRRGGIGVALSVSR